MEIFSKEKFGIIVKRRFALTLGIFCKAFQKPGYGYDMIV